MPRFYCDYCDAYLTHDSMSGRQQHMRGWKHRENFKLYYQTYFPQWAMETQMQQMQNPQYQMMIAAYMPPPFAGAAPDGSFDMQAQQAQQMQQMQMQQMQMQSQQMIGGQMPTAGGVPPPMMPPVFRPPPSMAPPAATMS